MIKTMSEDVQTFSTTYLFCCSVEQAQSLLESTDSLLSTTPETINKKLLNKKC